MVVCSKDLFILRVMQLCRMNKRSNVPCGDAVLEACFRLDVGSWLAVWHTSNALSSINIVALRQIQLIPGWVTVCGRVNHHGM